jgi:ubiquinone/menaquinone biosynthesis C-methylase UbiE
MLRQAARRYRAAVAAGRVDLRLGDAARLPWPDGCFTRVAALHTVQFWPSVEAGLREAHRVLAPGVGRLALGLRMRREAAGRFDPSRYGFTEAQVAEIREALAAIGFRSIEARRRDFGREVITALLARR